MAKIMEDIGGERVILTPPPHTFQWITLNVNFFDFEEFPWHRWKPRPLSFFPILSIHLVAHSHVSVRRKYQHSVNKNSDCSVFDTMRRTCICLPKTPLGFASGCHNIHTWFIVWKSFVPCCLRVTAVMACVFVVAEQFVGTFPFIPKRRAGREAFVAALTSWWSWKSAGDATAPGFKCTSPHRSNIMHSSVSPPRFVDSSMPRPSLFSVLYTEQPLSLHSAHGCRQQTKSKVMMFLWRRREWTERMELTEQPRPVEWKKM